MAGRHRGRRRMPSREQGPLGGQHGATLRGRRLLIAVIALVLPLSAAGALMARRSAALRSGNARPAQIRPESAPALSKEFIYAGSGSKLIATEEPGPGSGCTYLLSTNSNTMVPSGGGPYSVSVTAGTGCTWTATSPVTWISITSGSSGSGNGTVNYTVAPNTASSPQTAQMTIAGQQFTVTEAGTSCSYSIMPTSQGFAAGGGSSSVSVFAGTGCAWTATTPVTWITITSGSSGSGNGMVNYTVAANTSSQTLTATMTIAGQPFMVSVAPPSCTYSIAPQNQSFPASGGGSTVTVTAGAGCAWTASSSVQWITITTISSTCGTGVCGNGQITYSVAPNAVTQQRQGTMTIAGQTYTVTQAAACAFSFTPTSLNFPSGGATESFSFTMTGTSCTWTVTSADPWITVNAPTSGSGTGGMISLTVGQNPNSVGRSGSITINGAVTYPVTQDASVCGFQVTPTMINVPQGGGTFNNTLNVATGSNCSWTACGNVSWILIPGGNGCPVGFTGSSAVPLTVNANTGTGTRQAQMTIAGVTVTVTQPGLCGYSLSSSGQSFTASGGTGSFNVLTQTGCAWTAAVSNNTPWITITAGSSGSGNGTVSYSVAANTSGTRSGSITAAGQTFTITQSGSTACPTVSTFSGTGVYGYLEGNPTTAQWADPTMVATAKEPAGANAVFIADTDNSRIRMVYIDGPNAGLSILIAGNGVAGYSPPGGDATQVSLNGPRGIAALVNSSGVVTAIFFADTGNNMIRKLTPPAAGSGPWSIADFSGTGIAGYTDGAPASAQFNAPQGLAVASNGTVYVADASNGFIRALDTSGNASTYAGGPNVGVNTPVGLALSKNTGNLFATDQVLHSIFSFGSGGFPTTRIAGSGSSGFADGTGTAARFNSPYQLAWATTTADGEILYIADRLNQRLRKLVLSSNAVTTYVGSGTAGFADSSCSSAQFNWPSGTGVGPAGEVYVADAVNNRIRKVQ
jgi:hypothetical protein